MTKRGIFGFVFPGSAEKLIMRGGITNNHLIACFLSNISAKNYQNRLMCFEVIVCYVGVAFLRWCICVTLQLSFNFLSMVWISSISVGVVLVS